MRILRIDHVQVAIPPGGEDRATEFYGALLGLAPVAKPEQLASRGGCWFGSGGVSIHCGVEAEFRPAKKAHPALVVEGLDELAASLRAAGHPVEEGSPVDGRNSVYVHDPFGNRIELIAG